MEHLFIKGKNGSDRTLILFHGTGGRETDLLEVATMVNGSANVLALRGAVDENGQTRYFKRNSSHEYDQGSLKEEGDRTASKIEELASVYGLDLSKAVYIGYSNGANMAAYLMLNHEIPVAGGLFLHPAYRSELIRKDILLENSVLITAGARDMMATAGEAYELKKHLELKGASVEVKLTDGGHEIVSEELMEGHVWYLKVENMMDDL